MHDGADSGRRVEVCESFSLRPRQVYEENQCLQKRKNARSAAGPDACRRAVVKKNKKKEGGKKGQTPVGV